MRPTLAQIAEQAGCSKATVSLALRGDTRVKRSTREKVAAIAANLGYRPDPLLARLAAERWRRDARPKGETLACVVFRSWKKFGLPQRSLLFPALRAQAERHGFRLEIFFREDFPNIQALAKVLTNRGINGLLLAGTMLPEHTADLEQMPWERFATVAFELGFHRPPCPLVREDMAAAARLLYDKALAAGHRRIGVLMGTKGFSLNDESIESGFVYARHRAGRAVTEPPITNIGLNPRNLSPIRQWFELHRPDALLFEYPFVIHEWRRWETRPALGVLRLHEDNPPPCSGVITPQALIQTTAVDLLIDRLHRSDFGAHAHPVTIEVPSVWHDGGTL